MPLDDVTNNAYIKLIPAVVLFSGGMDSTTLLLYAKGNHQHVHALIIDYEQRHRKEIENAVKITNLIGIDYSVIKVNVPKFAGSPLVDKKTPVPNQHEKKQDITIVPLRNTLFLTQACALAASFESSKAYVYIGAVSDDQITYPDCRTNFFKKFQLMLDEQDVKITVKYPFISLEKTKIIELGEKLGVPWYLTWTCYKGREKACGKCNACKERLNAFSEIGLKDPLEYEKEE
ncbi:MAG: 7-cyano-7-deazaguanine synthase QueC [Candidatus Hodarchaeales archaeon]